VPRVVEARLPDLAPVGRARAEVDACALVTASGLALFLLNKYGTALIIALGLCVYTIHMQHSNIAGFGVDTKFAIDSYSHLEYIARVDRHHWTVPAPDACWECHQPPLYYMLAAIPYSIARRLRLSSADVEVQAPPVLLGRCAAFVGVRRTLPTSGI
jgi:hypothetical protein